MRREGEESKRVSNPNGEKEECPEMGWADGWDEEDEQMWRFPTHFKIKP